MDGELAISMRKSGMTYGDIAKHFGVSRQRVYQVIRKSCGCIPRRYGNIYDNIPYVGLYELFKDNPSLTASHLSMKCLGSGEHATVQKCYNMLSGRNVFLSIQQIKRLIKFSGKSFEELFEPRKIE